MASIYGLMCKVNGFVYVGCTKSNIGKRMREHRCLLRAGKHKVTNLQTDWFKFGEQSFRMLLLEELKSDDLQTRQSKETEWLKRISAANQLYNQYIISFRPSDEAISKGVEAARTVIGNRWSPEANAKRRDTQLGVPKGHGAKISATKLAKRS